MKTRRILSLVVAALLLVSTLAVIGLLNVTAAEVEISDAEGFKAITGDGNYKLTADIDLTGADFTTIEAFSGTLDGNGKTVKGISTPLFNTLSGEVKNVTLEGAITTDATGGVGVLANKVSGTLTVSDTVNKVSVTALSATGAGGFVGVVEGASDSELATVTITSSVNEGAIAIGEGGSHGAGGFVGAGTRYAITITESVNTGAITLTSGDSGAAGFFGGSTSWNKSHKATLTIRYSVNHGTVTGGASSRTGGFAGRLDRSANCAYTFEYCYNTGAITGGSSASGVTGYTNVNAKVIANYCYNIGALESGSKYALGAVGDNKGKLTANENYYIGTVTIPTGKPYEVTATEVADTAALVAALVKDGSDYVVEDGKNNGNPILAWQCGHSGGRTTDCVGEYCALCGTKLASGSGEHSWGEYAETTPATAIAGGEETRICSVCFDTETKEIPATGTITPVDGVYNVTNEAQLVWLAYHMNAGTVGMDIKIAIKADITLTNGMTHIAKTFTGTFDGENHIISGINDIIFAKLAGTFKNVTLEGEINSSAKRSGTVASETPNEGGAHLANVHSRVNIVTKTNGGNYGGIIGYTLGHNTIIGCTYSGTLTVQNTGSAIGGIVGYTNRNGGENPIIKDCRFDGTIVFDGNCTDSIVGGIYGNHNANNGGDQIIDCVVTGTITVSEETTACQIGGIAGGFRNTKGNTSKLENCVFNGTINGTGTVGAIAGNLSALSEVVNCISLATDYPICPTLAGTVTNTFAGADVQTIGEPLTMGGATYQKYAVGYINTATSKLSVAMSSDDAVKPYISIRDNGAAHDLRFAFLTKLDQLGGVSALNVTITFKNGDTTVKTYTGAVTADKSDLVMYQSLLAAGEPYFAADGSAFFAVVITDIPDGDWSAATVTVTDNSGAVLVDGATVTYADIIG